MTFAMGRLRGARPALTIDKSAQSEDLSMQRQTSRSIPWVLLCVLLTSTAAEAANDSIATAWQAVLGEKRSQELAPGEAGYYGVFLQPWRSFVAFCWEPTLEDQSADSGACQVEIRTDSDAAFPNAHPSGEPYPKRGSSVTFEPLAAFGPAPAFDAPFVPRMVWSIF
jgi:hypothetical protein